MLSYLTCRFAPVWTQPPPPSSDSSHSQMSGVYWKIFHLKIFPTIIFSHLIDSSCQLRTSLRDIFFLNRPFFWMLRLLAAKFSKSVKVPADRVEWMLAETDKVEPEIFCQDYSQILLRFVQIFLQSKYFAGEMMFAKLLKQFAWNCSIVQTIELNYLGHRLGYTDQKHVNNGAQSDKCNLPNDLQ